MQYNNDVVGTLLSGSIDDGFDNDYSTSYTLDGGGQGNSFGTHYTQNILEIPTGAVIRGLSVTYSTTSSSVDPAFRFYANSGSGSDRVDFSGTASTSPRTDIFEITAQQTLLNLML